MLERWNIILVLYYLGISMAFTFLIQLPFLWKLLFAIIPLPFAGISIYVLLERIKEIRSGEEDDLNEY